MAHSEHKTNEEAGAAIESRTDYYLVTHHNTFMYADPGSQRVRHAAFGIAPLNLVLKMHGPRGRLVFKGDALSDGHELSFEQPIHETRAQGRSGNLHCDVESFADDGIALKIGPQYVSADSDGFVRNNRPWCREWERFRLVRADTLEGIALLRQHSWLSHRDRRVLSLAAHPVDPEQERPAEPSTLLTTLVDMAIDPRRELVFGPARVPLVGKGPSLLIDKSDGGHHRPARLHVVDARGAAHSFSRFKPLVYFCVYGHDSYYECLRLSLISLATHGRYNGTIGVACDRPASEVMKFIPDAFHNRLIVSAASKDRGWFNRYYLDHRLYDDFQPVLYSDVDVVFDCDIINLLIDILLQRQVCCATEAYAHTDLAGRSPRLWDDYAGNYFGRFLYAAEPEFPEESVPLANSGVVGFDGTARVCTVNKLVKAIAGRQTSERLRVFGDQPILNYVLHKTGLGNFELVNRYCRLTRKIEDASPADRRGLVHFHLASGAADGSAKSSIMASYLDRLDRHEAAAKDDRADVQLNLTIAGQMTAVELERLARLARLVPPNGCIVEIGSLFGLSSWTLAKNAHPSVTVYCIDPWVREPWMAEVEASAGQTLSLETFRKNVGDTHNIIPLPGYSPRDFIGWQRAVDMIFEDSVHTNPTLHETLTFWSRFVRPSGVVCGHDYCDEFSDVKAEAHQLATALGAKVEVAGTLWSVSLPPNRR